MQELQSTVHDLSEERTNIERQADATARAVRTLDRQLGALADEESDDHREPHARAGRARDQAQRAEEPRARHLQARGRCIPWRPCSRRSRSASSWRATSTSTSSRSATARWCSRVEALGRADRATSARRSRRCAATSRVRASRRRRRSSGCASSTRGGRRSLAQAEAKERQAESRLAQIAKDESRLGSVIASLEVERKRAEGRSGGAAPSSSTLKTSDFGRLDWPVEGTIIYQFGRLVNPNNTTTRWLGIGIAAAEGTPVKAVAAGVVALVDESFGTYGRTVMHPARRQRLLDLQFARPDLGREGGEGRQGPDDRHGRQVGPRHGAASPLRDASRAARGGSAGVAAVEKVKKPEDGRPEDGSGRGSRKRGSRTSSARRAHLDGGRRGERPAARGRDRRDGDADLHQAAEPLGGARGDAPEDAAAFRDGARRERRAVHQRARQLPDQSGLAGPGAARTLARELSRRAQALPRARPRRARVASRELHGRPRVGDRAERRRDRGGARSRAGTRRACSWSSPPARGR